MTALAMTNPSAMTPTTNETHRQVGRCGVTGQRQAASHGAVRLLPAQQPHPAGEDCQGRQQHAERAARTGDRELRNELYQGDRRGEQPQRGALPGQEGPLVGQGEPVVGLDLGLGALFAGGLGGVIGHDVPRRA